MTDEVGKPITEARAEIAKCAWVCRSYADEAAGMLADRHVATDRSKSYVHQEPLGVILAVMRWNFAFGRFSMVRFAHRQSSLTWARGCRRMTKSSLARSQP
jgi:succinate-semialdehyde dehydrogenase/glutarate-semialdehyde dehydrogenase